MVYPRSRSMNAALMEGSTDGKYKKVVQDRDLAEPATYDDRADLFDLWYGIHEGDRKVSPGNAERITNTPNYVRTKPVEDYI